jgi:tagaturonate reductase
MAKSTACDFPLWADKKNAMTKRILQFGTSRFLQAHVDLFAHEARAAGQDVGPITVVKTTTGVLRAGRVQAFARREGFPVRIKGIRNGMAVDEMVTVRSVARALAADHDWAATVQAFSHETDIVVSNVGDAGYALHASDRIRPNFAEAAPPGFVSKLLGLLVLRFESGGTPLLILPCELISNNGSVLRQLLKGLADDWSLGADFKSWLADTVICNTLVDRIVSEAIEPIGAVGEPYALWAIQREPGFEAPFTHPAVIITDDLEPYLRLKLHILNLGHTYLAGIWKSEERPPGEFVREILSDTRIRERLLNLYESEVVPGFAARGMQDEARRYVAQTLERFDNPYLDHRISDIFENHAIKIERRAKDFMTWVREKNPAVQFPQLEALIP